MRFGPSSHISSFQRGKRFGRLWHTRFGWFSKQNKPYKLVRWMIEETIPGMLLVLKRASNAPAAAVQVAVAQAATADVDRRNPIDELTKLSWVFRQLQRLLNSQYPAFGSGSSGASEQHDMYACEDAHVVCHLLLAYLCGQAFAGSGDGSESHAKKGPRRSRSAELIGLAAVDICLGVSSSINCKSGCDRSGIVHALTTAIHLRYADNADSAWQIPCFWIEDTKSHVHVCKLIISPVSLPGQNCEGCFDC